jgi:hypothetical protein
LSGKLLRNIYHSIYHCCDPVYYRDIVKTGFQNQKICKTGLAAYVAIHKKVSTKVIHIFYTVMGTVGMQILNTFYYLRFAGTEI